MGAKSRRKGCRGELELAALMREHGLEARRGQQFSGSPDSPDVVSSLEWLHPEVKRAEKISLYQAMAQAIADCGDRMPVVFHRRNHSEWLVILRASDFLTLAKEKP